MQGQRSGRPFGRRSCVAAAIDACQAGAAAAGAGDRVFGQRTFDRRKLRIRQRDGCRGQVLLQVGAPLGVGRMGRMSDP